MNGSDVWHVKRWCIAFVLVCNEKKWNKKLIKFFWIFLKDILDSERGLNIWLRLEKKYIKV
jgi:hypothetical protein